MLIGLTGKKRRGKDSVANYLVEKYGFNKHGFADKVKEFAYAINPVIILAEGLHSFPFGTRLQTIVDTIGWEKAKEIPEVRSFLQKTGTEGGRTVFNPIAPHNSFWIKLLFAQLEAKYDIFSDVTIEGQDQLKYINSIQSNIVISDCRFDNEAEAIKAYGGLVIKVDSSRAGLPEPDAHASEVDISPNLIDGTLHNETTLEDLYSGVETLLAFTGFNKSNEVVQGTGN